MQSKTLLVDISERYPEQPFTCKEVAYSLNITRKLASNGLRRLHQMGFVNRQRQKRFCLWSRRKTLSVKFLNGIPYQVHARKPLFFPSNKGFEYSYSLSRQGRSYVKWLKDQKPLEDTAYFALLKDVMTALPEDLRHRLGTLGAVRADYKYHGPARQLRLIDNPANPLLVVDLENQSLHRENERPPS
jgi:hypothetical protein